VYLVLKWHSEENLVDLELPEFGVRGDDSHLSGGGVGIEIVSFEVGDGDEVVGGLEL